jgi:hypothetical protein
VGGGREKMKKLKTAKDIKFRVYKVKRGHAAALMPIDIDIAIAKLSIAPTIPFFAKLAK